MYILSDSYWGWDKKKKSSVASCGEALFFFLSFRLSLSRLEPGSGGINDCKYECCPLYDCM